MIVAFYHNSGLGKSAGYHDEFILKRKLSNKILNFHALYIYCYNIN